jgi:MYXO-CTERM domain-containing protein
MYRLAMLSLIAGSLLFANTIAVAEEGKVAEPTVVPDANRTSSYSRGVAPNKQPNASSMSKQTRRHLQAKAGTVTSKPARGTIMMSNRSDSFYIYDAVSTLRMDRDADGYHSEFRVRFDADVRVGDALVYAKLYLRRAGESEWFLYRETDDFWIYGQSEDDDYYVTTTLDAGYATGEYDVLIDLYESGYKGIVATLGPLESGALSYLPLEEVGLDAPIEMAGYSIGEIFTGLVADDDDDGYYSRFRITFDPDADYESRFVFARVWVRARGGEWIEEYVSEDWPVDVSGDADAYVLDVDWIEGYPTSYYDVQIDLYDAATEALIASAGSERADLAQLPLEDRSRDQILSPPPPPSGGGSSHSREGGGGSTGLWLLLGLLGFAGFRKRN